MLPNLNKIAAIQAKPTLHKNITPDMLLDYAYTYSNASICHHASDMILHGESYTNYLVIPGARSLISDH